MQSIRRILVTVRDPHVRRVPALAKAVQLATACHASIELFHGIATEIPVEMVSSKEYPLEALQRDLRDRALKGLERLAAPWRRAGLRVTTAAEWDFPLHEAVIRQALQTRADLIVAHQHGKHRFPHLLHYTDWELLRESPVPVLLVRSPRTYRASAVLAAVDPGHSFAKPARLDTLILRRAQTVASALKAPLHVVHAFLPMSVPQSPGRAIYLTPAEIEKRAQQRAQKLMKGTLAHLHLPTRQRHLEEGHPAVVIPALTRRLRADLVVMGAVSRSGWQRLLIGNTAERVIDDLKCDLLIVKPAHFAAKVPRKRRGVLLVPTPYVP
jgi:universal stress protein E